MKDPQEKKSLAEKLGRVLSNENIPNSYYNDEYYTPCKCPDYDKAYQMILTQDCLDSSELEKTFPMKDKENGGTCDFTLKDLLKITVVGDFGSQYKTTSSQSKNFEAINKLWDLSTKHLKKEEHEELWCSKKETNRESRRELRGRDYQKAYLDAKSLAQMAGSRFDFYSITDKTSLQWAEKIAKKMLKNKEFKSEAVDSYELTACQHLLNYAEDTKERDEISKKIRNIAGFVKAKAYDKIVAIDHYDLRRLAIKATLFGQSNDKYFDNVLKSIESIENMISKRGKELDIEI